MTPKQARFVEEFALDQNATQAAIRAGYSEKSAHVNGPRMLANARIAEAIAKQRAAVSKRLNIDLDNIVKKLEDVFQAAFQAEDWQAARGAATDQAKVLGIVIDRKHVTMVRVEQMSEEQCVAALGEETDGAGSAATAIH